MRSGKFRLLLLMRPFQGVRDLILDLIFFNKKKKKSKTGSDYGFDVVVASWEHLLLWACNKKYYSGHAFVSYPILESHLGLIWISALQIIIINLTTNAVRELSELCELFRRPFHIWDSCFFCQRMWLLQWGIWAFPTSTW